MGLKEKYLYEVLKRLSEDDREVAKEDVSKIINERVKANKEDISHEEKMHKALEGLGDPALLAKKYSKKQRYLIGPNNFDIYIYVLRIVLIAVFFGITIATIIGVSLDTNLLTVDDIVLKYLSNIFDGLLHGLVWVTIIFAIIDYQNISLKDNSNEKKWKASDLESIPSNKGKVSRLESMVGVILSVIFFSMIYFTPDKLKIYYKVGNDFGVVPLLNIDVLNTAKMIIIVIFVLGLIKEVIKIICGRWNINLAIISSTLTITSSVLIIEIFGNKEIWSSEMINKINQIGANIFTEILNICILTIVIITIIDVATSFYKGIRYGKEK